MNPINPIDRYNEELLLKVYDVVASKQLEDCLDALQGILDIVTGLRTKPLGWTKLELELALSNVEKMADRCIKDDERIKSELAFDAREDARLEAGDRAHDEMKDGAL